MTDADAILLASAAKALWGALQILGVLLIMLCAVIIYQILWDWIGDEGEEPK